MNRTLHALAIVFSVGCTGQSDLEPTWYTDVEPIAAERCAGCHQPGAIAGFLDLTDGPTAKAWAAPIHDAIDRGAMPPFPAAGGDCEPVGGFQNDTRLTEVEREVMLEWAGGTAALGEPTTEPPEIVVEQLDEVSAVLRAPGEIRVPSAAEASDTFVCIVLDPELDQTVWLDGFELSPDDAEVVHHVLVNQVEREEARARDEEDGVVDGAFPCFSGVDIPGSKLLAGWIPGAPPMRYPEGSGARLDPDQVLVAQMHYHGVAEDRFDWSELGVHWVERAPLAPATLRLLGNARTAEQGLQPGPADADAPQFLVPAGIGDHTETSVHTLPLAGRTADPFMVVPHMHYAGTGIRAQIEHEDGSRECLVDVPAYDFDWQLFYFLDPEESSRRVSEGDTIVVECTFDNTVDNPSLASALTEAGLDAPVDIGLGQGTLDEMCLVAIGAVPNP